MKSKINYFLLISILISPSFLYSQRYIDQLHGDQKYVYSGIMNSNNMAFWYWNDSFIGFREDMAPNSYGLAWPKDKGHNYTHGHGPTVSAEVVDINGQLIHITTGAMMKRTAPGAIASDYDPATGTWWTWTPLPDFGNNQKVAMSTDEDSWPSQWPDKMEAEDSGWPNSWNGYFGRDQFNADEEAFFMFDDYTNAEFAFFPDSTDFNRRGLGMRVTARILQWANPIVQDMTFVIYDIKNIGTSLYQTTNFGLHIGPHVGSLSWQMNPEGLDDMGTYNLEEDIAISWDKDGLGLGGYQTGYAGYAYLESPGNPYDGIDNDGDGYMGSGDIIDEFLWEPKLVKIGDPIVIINYLNYQRKVTTMPDTALEIKFRDIVMTFTPGDTLKEIPRNSVDDNLNGIIDENNGMESSGITRYLYAGTHVESPIKYINYFTGNGLDNPLIEERRDDGIDNNDNWDPTKHDVGLDGKPGTGDFGENDGLPTSGWDAHGNDTGQPGEPNIDKTDINESDMIGLTAFYLYEGGTVRASNDEEYWQAMVPGRFDDVEKFGNTDYTFSSGYFPIVPEQIERFSVGIIMGADHEQLFRNKERADIAYDANYNFAQAPVQPTVKAVAGDGKVTLYWDNAAESSFDRLLDAYDFEGYRIYRSTDPGWNDMTVITNGYGEIVYRKPVAQFDIDNEYQGFAESPLDGIQFYLGNNKGLRHSWTDTTVQNGYTYYYSVTSYDRGDKQNRIPPSECTKHVAILSKGQIEKGKNVVIVRPSTRSTDYVEASSSEISHLQGLATGSIDLEIIEPNAIKSATYQIIFEDTMVGDSLLQTKNYTLINTTNSDTLVYKGNSLLDDDMLVKDGFLLSFENDKVALDRANSFWAGDGDESEWIFDRYKYKKLVTGKSFANNYRIEFFNTVGVDTSLKISLGRNLRAIPVNFKIYNTTYGPKNDQEVELDFAFREIDKIKGENGFFTASTKSRYSDEIIFLEKNDSDSLVATWQFSLLASPGDSIMTKTGDFVEIVTFKPLTEKDIYSFTLTSESYDASKIAESSLDKIKVVPNPYIVTNSWEPANTYSTGRGDRGIHFTHLPAKCIIRIYDIQGQLVDTIERKTNTPDGTEIWNMLTKDEMEISYGVYIFHVDAESIGQNVGKFAVIK